MQRPKRKDERMGGETGFSTYLQDTISTVMKDTMGAVRGNKAVVFTAPSGTASSPQLQDLREAKHYGEILFGMQKLFRLNNYSELNVKPSTT